MDIELREILNKVYANEMKPDEAHIEDVLPFLEDDDPVDTYAIRKFDV